MYLQRILQARRESAQFQAGRSRQSEFERIATSAEPTRPFAEALQSGPWPRIIAEIKRASPSKGVLKDPLDPTQLAREYEEGGAVALSILTEPDFFRGSPDDLKAGRAATRLPVLRKDFLLEPWEVYQSRAMGADAILLIAAALPTSLLGEMQSLAHELGMAALVEIHDEAELQAVLGHHPRLVGINNRNLKTFQVDRSLTRRLGTLLPQEVVRVSESGFFTRAELDELPEVNAFLVGESLVTAEDPSLALRRLREVMRTV